MADIIIKNEPVTFTLATVGVVDGGGSGYIYVFDVTPTTPPDTVTAKVFQDPASTVLQTCTSSAVGIDLSIRASYPEIVIDNVQQFLTQPSLDHYAGITSIVLVGNSGDDVAVKVQVKTPNDTGGALHIITVTLS